MHFKARQKNRLENYNYSRNGAYFITICTKDRKRILSNIVGDDAHIVPKEYGKIVEKYICNASEIKKYVIMPDHIHLIIEIDNYDHVIRNQEDYNEIWEYIENNPQKWEEDCFYVE